MKPFSNDREGESGLLVIRASCQEKRLGCTEIMLLLFFEPMSRYLAGNQGELG